MKTAILATFAALTLMSAPAMAGNGGAANINHNSANSSSSTSSSSNASNRNVNNNVEKRQPGAIGLPGLTSSGGCPIGSVSVGGGFPGGSLGFGFTKGDGGCRSAFYAEQLRRMGFKKQSIQLMVNEIPEVRRAFGFK